MRRHSLVIRICLLALLADAVAIGGAASAQEPPAADSRDTLGWHEVQPGETLQSITQRYLGTPHLWSENARLNPGIGDPQRIYPGQRIRVIIQREVPARQVEIRTISNAVDKNLQLAGWEDAAAGDLLKPRDGVRTQQASSTELAFDDGSLLTLGEYSQVFVKDVRTTLRGIRRGTIEIERGQAELVFRAQRPDTTEIEVITGSAVTRPQVDFTGRSTTRARKSRAGGSEVMVYGGRAEVESGGAVVAVERGMGTAVPEGGVPQQPEKLLDAPETLTPERRSEWHFSNPRMSWKEVEGAAAYTVEVCRDPACAALVSRSELDATTWIPGALPAGDLFWRVTAKAASGLDGFPSRADAFRIDGETADLEPPAVACQLRGPGLATPAEGFLLGIGGALELLAEDDASGVAEVRYRWNGGAWRRYAGGLIRPLAEGEHVLELEADDQLGRTSPIRTLHVELDETPPAVPKIDVIRARPSNDG